jgi:hypothetical protein
VAQTKRLTTLKIALSKPIAEIVLFFGNKRFGFVTPARLTALVESKQGRARLPRACQHCIRDNKEHP